MAGKKKESATFPQKWEDVPEIPKEEQPYPLPKGWKWVKLLNIAKWGSGGTPSRKHPEYYIGDIAWLKTGELEDNEIYLTEEHITQDAINNSSTKIFPINTVVMAMYGATIGKLGILKIEAATNQACACASCFNFIFYKYLFFYLLSQRDEFINLGKGGAQPNISQEVIKNYRLPLPPLETQQRIVNHIESLFSKLDEAAEKVQAVIDSHEARKQAILHKAFSGELTRGVEIEEDDYYKEIPEIPKEEQPYPLPEGWKWVKIGDILNLQAGKNITSLDISSIMTADYLYPCYGANGIRGYVKECNRTGKHYIIGRQGALCGNINLAIGKFYATEHAIVIDTKIQKFNIDYAGIYLKYMNLNQYATATAQPGLAVNNIVKLPFLLPPLEIQQVIVTRIESLFAKLIEESDFCLQVIDKTKQLKTVILNKAFRREFW